MTSLLKKKPSKDDLLDHSINIEFSDQYESTTSSVSSSPILTSNNGNNSNNNKNTGNFKLPEQQSSIKDMIVMLFGVDLRSLAAMRIGLSLLILFDLWVRSLYLHDHYTDLGIMPVGVIIENNAYYWSLFYLNSSYTFACFLFICNVIAALCMLVGYKSKLSNIICWILMTSIHVRNPYVLNGGDDFFRLFVFWAMFLPTGSKYSIDSILNLEYSLNRKSNCLNPKSITYSPIQTNTTSGNSGNLGGIWMKISKLFSNIPTTDSNGKYYLSWASFAIQIQFVLVYLITAALKTGVEWNVEYSAVWFALHLDQFTTPLGKFLRQFIGLGKFLTWFSIMYEWYGTLLFFIPIRKFHGPLRTLGVIGFWCMHIGFGSCMELGFFMFIPGMCCLVFLPSWFWDELVFKYLYNGNSNSNLRTSAVIWINDSSNNQTSGIYKLLSIYKQFFLLHSTPILITKQQQQQQQQQQQSSISDEMTIELDGISIINGKSIHNELKEKNYLWAIENSITGERVFGYDAFLTLINLSPSVIQYLNFWIFNRQWFERLYNYIGQINVKNDNAIVNPIYKLADQVYPTKVQVVKRRWIIEIFCMLVLVFVVNWNFAGLYGYGVPVSVRWIGPALKVEQYWSMFSPYPSKDNGWLVYPATLVDGTTIDIATGLEVTYDRPDLISATFPTQRWRKYLMNLQGSTHRDKRLHYGRYLCREWNWSGKHTADKQLKTFKMIFMWEVSPDFPTWDSQSKTYISPPRRDPEPIELWSHVC